MNTSNEIDAIKFTLDLKETYIRYLYTANIISDSEPELQNVFFSKLNKDFSIN